MPWRCPACTAQIIHNPNEATPRLGVVYRCAICHLELVLNPDTSKLLAARIIDMDDDKPLKFRYR